MRYVLTALGLVGAGWVLVSAATTPGLLLTPAFMQVQIGWLCLVVVGLLWGTPYRTTVLWGSLSLVGYALTLQLVDAGTAVLYQHLRPAVAPLGPQDWRILAGLAAYAGVVVVGIAGRAPSLVAWVDRRLGRLRLVVLLGAWAVISASPLRDLGGFALEIVLSTALAITATFAVILAAASLPPEATPATASRVDRFLGHDDEPAAIQDPVALACAGVATLVSATLALVVWERHPHLSDEISFLFQAQYFANGSLVAPGAPVPELFGAYQIECEAARCLSVLQPGWPALLSLGVRLGTAWLVNPLLAGVNVLLLFAFVRELYGARLARGAALLMACSPWYLFLGMSYMNHQATLLGGLIAVLGTTLALRRRHPGWAVLAGAGTGFASFMRPMDGVIVATVAGLPLLWMRRLRRRSLAVALFIVSTAAVGSLNLAYNRAITGNPLEFPVTSYVNELWGEGTNNLGFGPDRGIYPMWAHMDGFPGHSPFQAAVNADLNVTALQADLFGWATGSFLPILLLLVWGRLRKPDWLMVGWVVVINALYALYWFASGPDFAARYWFLGVVPFAALAARGVQELTSSVDPTPGRARAAMGVASALLMLQALLVFVPWRATDKYHRYFDGSPAIRNVIERRLWPPGIYLIRGANQPDYAAAIPYTAPDLANGDYVFAYDSLSDSADRLRRAYPGRKLLWLSGPSVTGGGYRVYAEPPPAR